MLVLTVDIQTMSVSTHLLVLHIGSLSDQQPDAISLYRQYYTTRIFTVRPVPSSSTLLQLSCVICHGDGLFSK